VETEVRDINGLQRFWNEGRSEFSVVVGSIGNTLTQTSTPGMHKRNTKRDIKRKTHCKHHAITRFIRSCSLVAGHLPALFIKLDISLECISLNAVLDVQIYAAIQHHPVSAGIVFIVNLMEM
jgi:hypothetical protein